MKALTSTLGRALLSLPLLVFGSGHLANASQMAGMVPAWVPGGIVWVYITGVALLAAAVSFNIRKHDQLAGLLAALLLAAFALSIHLPGMLKPVDPGDAVGAVYKMTAMGSFFKDLGLAGGALLLSASAKG